MKDSPISNIELSEVEIENESYYRISNVDKMRPFFMSIVSDSNHWMFIGSNGGLSAGRKDSENALFPYYTDDKIVESTDVTGSKSIFLVTKDSKQHVWEPFSIRYATLYKLSRNLYKNRYGNKVLFEETNHDLGLTFRYSWNSSNKYGFVRKSRIINNTDEVTEVNFVDGIQNVIPYGVGSTTQNDYSNLVDAYKRSELEINSGIGIFALSAIIVDKAEPSEALKANIAWSFGLDQPTYLVSSLQLDAFRKGQELIQEEDIKAEKGAYFVSKALTLQAKGNQSWTIVANVNQDMAAVVSLSTVIQNDSSLGKNVSSDVEAGTNRLLELNASADGLQLSKDSLKNTRHFANSLFNIMRGGIFDNNYQIEKNDFIKYLTKGNKTVLKSSKSELEPLPNHFSLSFLLEVASASNDKAFKRLSLEYLPLKFSRRHGDPSRPWNRFSINTQDENDGSKILDYQGNWRDIFQNWEALAHSYPEFIEGMIFRFLNASTFDGYNPYRVTKNGIDWERIEPDDPWSYIGYWGDHQVIYLLKFLEFSENHYPGRLESYFDKDLFVYANVPYRIKPYDQLLANPKDTIDFDHNVDAKIMERWASLGADSALLTDTQDKIIQVNFIEKILASFLAKMSNFIPEGGIWMNTQRPEWNDANNALVGNGVSMVTLYYMLRFCNFTQKLLNNSKTDSVKVSVELSAFFAHVVSVLDQYHVLLNGKFNDKERKAVLDGLGKAGSSYRQKVYNHSFGGEKEEIATIDIQKFFKLSFDYLNHALKANKRSDGLYHAYNLMSVKTEEEVSISYLSEMLEGQVSVLSSGILSSEEALKVLDAMKGSKLFREDQYSYILYPDKQLSGFLQRNNIPSKAIESSELLKTMSSKGDKQLIVKDVNGGYHFNGNFKNANDLAAAMDQLVGGKYADLVKADRTMVLKIFEDVFNHKEFTGRSGTFFGYEGLGSIYWHMVSKLLLAIQEYCIRAIDEEENDEIIGSLLDHYYEVQAGIGTHKPPELYGAFPTDPYSHTPKTKGAQQPGMTGQVKEDVISRFGELGINVKQGKLGFNPQMLMKNEFLDTSANFNYLDVNSNQKRLEIAANSLCFTYCQVPVIYHISDGNRIQLELNNNELQTLDGIQLDESTSKKIFQRSGEVNLIRVDVDESMLK